MPYDVNRQNEYGDVGADVDDAGDVKERAKIDTRSRCTSIPDLASRSTFEDLDQRDGNVEEGVKVSQQLYEEVRHTPPVRREELRVE